VHVHAVIFMLYHMIHNRIHCRQQHLSLHRNSFPAHSHFVPVSLQSVFTNNNICVSLPLQNIKTCDSIYNCVIKTEHEAHILECHTLHCTSFCYIQYLYMVKYCYFSLELCLYIMYTYTKKMNIIHFIYNKKLRLSSASDRHNFFGYLFP
jgi:hypothetical protein